MPSRELPLIPNPAMRKKNMSAHPLFPGSHGMRALWLFVAAAMVMFTPRCMRIPFSVSPVTRTCGRIPPSRGSSSTTLLTGGSGSPALDRCSVFVFQLPNLGTVARSLHLGGVPVSPFQQDGHADRTSIFTGWADGPAPRCWQVIITAKPPRWMRATPLTSRTTF